MQNRMLRSTDLLKNLKETDSLLQSENQCVINPVGANDEHQSGTGVYGPDGFRAWMVALANFFINFIVGGLGRMSGILYVVFMEMFHVDRESASMPFSVQQATRNVFGPLAGILGQKYGVKNVTIAGSIIGIISVGACYFVMSVPWITVLWGLGFGICAALTTSLNQVPVDLYFRKHRTTAGGLSISGGCAAAFIFPVIIDCLISVHGMGITFLVMSVIIFFVIPVSLVLVDPPWKNESSLSQASSQDNETPNEVSKRSSYNTFTPYSPESIANKNPEIVDFEYLRLKSDYVFQLFVLTISDVEILPESVSSSLWNRSDTTDLVDELEDLYKCILRTLEIQCDSFNGRAENAYSIRISENGYCHQNPTDFSTESYQHPVHFASQCYRDNVRWLFFASKLQKLSECRQNALLSYFSLEFHGDVIRVMEILKNLNDWRVECDSSKTENKVKLLNTTSPLLDGHSEFQHQKLSENNVPRSNTFCMHVKTAIKLHANPIFLLICLCRTVFMVTFIPLLTIIVDFAMDQGLPKSSGKYMIALLSLGDLMGRLCLGWINDIGCLSLPTYMLISMLLLAISLAVMPFMQSASTLMPAVLIFGILQGSLFIRHQVLITKYMDSHEQAIGMGLKNLLSGLVGFVIPFYIGYFRDTLGSYNIMFYLNGAITAFVGFLWIFEPYFVKHSSNNTKYIVEN